MFDVNLATRISVDDITRHPWVNRPLPEKWGCPALRLPCAASQPPPRGCGGRQCHVGGLPLYVCMRSQGPCRSLYHIQNSTPNHVRKPTCLHVPNTNRSQQFTNNPMKFESHRYASALEQLQRDQAKLDARWGMTNDYQSCIGAGGGAGHPQGCALAAANCMRGPEAF
jgi:hypothetical protein